jgi:hypothetical protein
MTSLPLTSLLSQVLVALTIETDNEYEHRAPRGADAWLTSTAMYVNFLRFVPPEGVRMAEVAANAGARTPVHPAFHGMRRWGYVRYSPDIKGTPKVRDGEAIVHLTPAGAGAQRIWKQVLADVEQRWTDRGLDTFRAALVPVAQSIDRPLPEYFPVLDYDFGAPALASPISRPAAELGLLALLSQVSLAMTYDFEAESRLSLGMCANVLRPLGPEPIPVRDLPDMSGAAKRVWSAAVGRLEKLGLLVSETAASGRGKSVRLTDNGITARRAGAELLTEVDKRWREQRGVEAAPLRTELEAIVGDGRPGAPVFDGLTPYPECWRAKLEPISALPHQPLVMHRGGYPDGS